MTSFILALRRPLAVADRIHQQVAKRCLGERLAEDVEDLAAVGSRFWSSFSSSRVKTSPSRVLRRPGSTGGTPLAGRCGGCGRSAARSGWGSTEVVVDHQVGDLQVEAFAGGVGGEQDSQSRFLVNSSVICRRSPRRTPPWMARTASGCRAGADLVLEVVEGVAVFGEDDQLARPAVCVGGERVVLEDRRSARSTCGRCRSRGPAWPVLTSSARSMSSASSSSTVWAAVAASSSSSSSSSISSAVNSSASSRVEVDAGLGIASRCREDLLLLALEPLEAATGTGRSPRGWRPVGAAGR